MVKAAGKSGKNSKGNDKPQKKYSEPARLAIDDPNHEVHDYYREFLEMLTETKVPFMLGGAFALRKYTGIYRDTKDLDIFCKPSDYIRILKFFDEQGYKTEITDSRWLAKVFKDDYFIDIIFDTVNCICRVNDTWLENATTGELYGLPVKYIPAEELVWCKLYVQNRERFDGADLNHIFVRYGDKLNWKRLLSLVDPHWPLLYSQIINFFFVYPSKRDLVPRWLVDELARRSQELFDLPPSLEHVCRGPIIDQTQYQTDIKEWDFKVVTMRTV